MQTVTISPKMNTHHFRHERLDSLTLKQALTTGLPLGMSLAAAVAALPTIAGMLLFVALFAGAAGLAWSGRQGIRLEDGLKNGLAEQKNH
jgi:hypothetical protein